MKWDVLREELMAIPGFQEGFDELYPYHGVSLEVARLRGARDMTQTEFAQLVDMPQSTIARLESGRHNPSVRVLQRIATATDTELVIEFRRPKHKRRAETPSAAASSPGSDRTDEPMAASPTED